MEPQVDKSSSLSELSILNREELQRLDKVLKIILNTPVAQNTFVQVIHGKPAWHSQPSEEAREKYKEFIASFSTRDLKLDTQVR